MYERFGKRAFDIFLSTGLLVVSAPMMALIGAAVWLDDGSPVLFRQTRVGLHGKRFAILKFRTMRSAPETGEGFDAGDGSRVTRVGRVLRLTKLDELPQLLNVLRGDMSLVGPRPEVPFWVAASPERWERVLTVRPGITDYASIAYRHEEHELSASPDPKEHYRHTVMPRKLDLYEKYASSVSVSTDIRILSRTVTHLIRRA